MSHPLVVMTGWSPRSLTGAVWVVNVFHDRTARWRRITARRYRVRRRIRSWDPSTRKLYTCRPPPGSIGSAVRVSTMNFIALASWNFVDHAGDQLWPVGPGRAHVNGAEKPDAAPVAANIETIWTS
jgi:hypothetical protein